jgi:FixJ family two-component response regulator
VDNKEYTVVIVDDEEMVTTSLSTLSMPETDYNILTFDSPGKLYQFAEKLRDNEVVLLLVRNGLLHGKLWKQLTEKTKQLNIVVDNLERVQTKILEALI